MCRSQKTLQTPRRFVEYQVPAKLQVGESYRESWYVHRAAVFPLFSFTLTLLCDEAYERRVREARIREEMTLAKKERKFIMETVDEAKRVRAIEDRKVCSFFTFRWQGLSHCCLAVQRKKHADDDEEEGEAVSKVHRNFHQRKPLVPSLFSLCGRGAECRWCAGAVVSVKHAASDLMEKILKPKRDEQG